mgnify:CR=1 FL=1
MIPEGCVTCKECCGDGEVEYDHYVVDWDRGGYIDGRIETCEVCGGDGYVEADIEEE